MAAVLPFPAPQGYGDPPKRDVAGQWPRSSPSYPMAIMSASFVSPVLRCSRDVTSFGGMAVPTFQVTTVMLGRTKEEQANAGAQRCSLSPLFSPSSTMEALCLQQKWLRLKLSQGTYPRSLTPL